MQWAIRISGAPLETTRYFPFPILCTVVIILRSEEKGISKTRGYSASSSVFETGVACTSAASVGSPCTAPPETVQLLHSTANFKRFWPSAESIRSFPEAVASSTTVIRFCVKVPVLSEQMTLALPSVSTAGIRRTIPRFAAIRRTPMANTMVTTAGRPSGIAATAKLMEIKNISNGLICWNSPHQEDHRTDD